MTLLETMQVPALFGAHFTTGDWTTAGARRWSSRVPKR